MNSMLMCTSLLFHSASHHFSSSINKIIKLEAKTSTNSCKLMSSDLYFAISAIVMVLIAHDLNFVKVTYSI